MLKTLGLIETRSFVGAVASADSMLKNADIKIIGKEHLDTGEIILIIEGENSAVNSALEIGCEKARELGQLKLSYIISEPEAGLENIFGDIFVMKEKSTGVPAKQPDIRETKKKIIPSGDKTSVSKKEESKKEESKPSGKKKSEKNDEKKIKPQKDKAQPSQGDLFMLDQSNETINRLRHEALNEEPQVTEPEIAEAVPDPEIIDEVETVEEIKPPTEVAISAELEEKEKLDELNVHQLRRLARSTDGFPIKGREISKANRNVLLEHFKTLN